jgi:hypothetical protein
MSIAAQVPKLQSAIQALQTNSVSGTKQQEEAATNERLATLDQMINADRQSLLDKAMGTLPRDARGQIKPEFAHLPQKIARLVKVALDEDANYTAARDHTRKWFKQPGNVETAKSLAGGDLKKIYGTHQNVITQIVKEELAPYVGKLRAQSQYQQTQAARQMPKGGTSPDLAPPVPQSVNGRHPTDLRSRAQARFQQTRQGAL